MSVNAAPGTRVDNVTLTDVERGVVLERGPGNGGLEFSASASRALVPGINDDPSQSCVGIHERLRIGVAGCALPDAEAP